MRLNMPIRHYLQLRKLAEVRGESVSLTAVFILNKKLFRDDNWIDEYPCFKQFKVTEKIVL